MTPEDGRTGQPAKAARSSSSSPAAATAADAADGTSSAGQGVSTPRPGYVAGRYLAAVEMGRALWPHLDEEGREKAVAIVDAEECRMHRQRPCEGQTRQAQLRRRRDAARRLPPLADGRRDPLGGPTDGKAS